MSPRTPEQFEEIREEKRALIMETALFHFANEGYHTTTINHIAKHAGISKGLMYNYFSSKEELLSEIIRKSVKEVYEFFDVDRDGYLSEDEFEFFIRKVSQILKEKNSFWRLFLQIIMQNEVREQFLTMFLGNRTLMKSLKDPGEGEFLPGIIKVITGYFLRKKETRGPQYDPYLDLHMFILTIKGFAITYIYMDNEEGDYYNKTVEKIIETFK